MLSKLLVGISISFLLSFLYLLYLDKKMLSQLEPYINIEVERLTSSIINKAIREKMKKLEIESFIQKDNKEETTSLSYNMQTINRLKDEITSEIENHLEHLEEAEINDYHLFNKIHKGKFKRIKKGILAENSLNSLRNSIIFGNIGPTVPVRLFFEGQVKSEIQIDKKEYGINNLLIEVYIVITIKEQVRMPLSSKNKEIKLKELLGVNMIQGNIPNHYTTFSKETKT